MNGSLPSYLLPVLALLISVAAAQAQESASSRPAEARAPATQESDMAPASQPEKPAKPPIPRLVPYTDYRGDLLHRSAFTGDWGGVRQQLMDKGVRFDLNLTQTYQGNVAGGKTNTWYYQGGLRYTLGLDTTYMGLWPGGMLTMRGETKYGQSDNGHTGAIMPVNTDALYPAPGDGITCLSELNYVQFVAPQLGFQVGRVSLRLPTPFTGDETTQFMNTALFIPPILGTTFPLVTTAAGVIAIPAKWLTIATFVVDSEGSARVTGFDPDTVFTQGTSVAQIAQATIKPFSLTGHQGVIWTWSDKDRVAFQQDAFAVVGNITEGVPPALNHSTDDWSITYTFDQYLYTLPGKPDEGFGVFGYYGTGPGVVNPIQANYCLGLGGKGMIPHRAKDTYGVGYYFINLSDHLGRVLASRTEDEQGVELYYNIEITPWLHITPDLQVIDPARKSIDTDWVLGLRVRMDF